MDDKTYEIYVDSEFYARDHDRSRAVAIYHTLDDHVVSELDGKKKQLMEVWDVDKYAYPGKVLKEDIIHCPKEQEEELDVDFNLEAEEEQQHTRHRGIHF